MYYGYNDNKQLVMADEAFIELLGYNSFKELIEENIVDTLRFENSKIIIEHKNQKISSDFSHHEIYGTIGDFYLVELKNITVEKVISQTSKQKTSKKSFQVNYKEIYLDVEKISEDIGLSIDDYKLYLDSFIDQSIIDEKRLLEGNDKVIKNLSNLALTLKIPHINILLLKIKKLSHRERMPLIDQYYTKLALLTLEKPEDYEEEYDTLLEKDSIEDKEEVLNARFTDLINNVSENPEEHKQEAVKELQEIEEIEEIEEINEFDNVSFDELVSNTKETTEKETTEKEKKDESSETNKNFTLDNITALPISYNPQTAADELNLPVVLIEEFVEDFIEQAHQDKDHLLTSYYQKDMDNIHELGHKLKGAASNLRINELADILEEIQYCTEHDKLEGLFIKYWGHFLSLEDYMKQLKTA
jgi:HPt (histidine-containing phosphotransfer) domain-containing protein